MLFTKAFMWKILQYDKINYCNVLKNVKKFILKSAMKLETLMFPENLNKN